MTRALLILADRAFLPVGPSLLELWSVSSAIDSLKYAQAAKRNGTPEPRLVLCRMDSRTILSSELRDAASQIGPEIAASETREREIYKEVVKYHTVVSHFGRKGAEAAAELDALFTELIGDEINKRLDSAKQGVANG